MRQVTHFLFPPWPNIVLRTFHPILLPGLYSFSTFGLVYFAELNKLNKLNSRTLNTGFTTETLGRRLIIRFDRPEIMNPLSIHVLNNLKSVFNNIPEIIESTIFIGTGNVFASGADLREIAAVEPQAAREFSFRGQDLMNQIATVQPMTIAAINGYCFGGGLDLALACDRRIASPGAFFSHPGSGLGIITGWGGTQRLPWLVGQANALEMFFTARRIDASEALRIGLVDAIVDDALEAAQSLS
ncbi:MAG: enoyl-CoA hydratase/isomerase family protein [Pyrinomonadaceae bacterium]